MHIKELLYSDVIVFAHRCPNGEERLFNITSLLTDPRVIRHTVRKIEVQPQLLSKAYMGIEEYRLKQIVFSKDDDKPIIVALIGKEWVIIDGNHRYVAKIVKQQTFPKNKKYKYIHAKTLKEAIWQDHLIDGVNSNQIDILLYGEEDWGLRLTESLSA